MRDLVIFGATELAAMAHYCAVHEHDRRVAAFVVDVGYKTQELFHNAPVFEWPNLLKHFDAANTDFFVAIGYRSMRRRRAIYDQVKLAGFSCINLISPASYVAKHTQLGENNLIMPGVVIEPNVTLGVNNVVWSNATICHDTQIGNHNFIAANTTLGGHVILGDTNFIGFSATVMQHVAIGNETLIGAQSLVRQSTQNLCQYWGVPATVRSAIDQSQGIYID